MKSEELKKVIRDVPNFPQEGIIFKDISTLLQDKKAFLCVELWKIINVANS